jgi:sulfur-oxidizing protein SoxB
MGQRITDIRIAGRPLELSRRYKATGWAALGEAAGPPAWDVVARHLRSVKRVRIDARTRVRVI